jgi:hypothetical protein
LTRGRTLHIRNTKIVKREEFWRSIFDISAFSGSRISRRQKFGIVSFKLPIHEIPGEENHFGISEILVPEGIGDREFVIKPTNSRHAK